MPGAPPAPLPLARVFAIDTLPIHSSLHTPTSDAQRRGFFAGHFRPKSKELGHTQSHFLGTHITSAHALPSTSAFAITTLKHIQVCVCPLQPWALLTPHSSGCLQAEAHKSSRKAAKPILPVPHRHLLVAHPSQKGSAPASSCPATRLGIPSISEQQHRAPHPSPATSGSFNSSALSQWI